MKSRKTDSSHEKIAVSEGTHFPIDEKLLEEARRLGAHRSNEEAVNTALAEYVRWHKQKRILAAFGTVDFDPEYDYKAERRRKRMG